MTRKIFITLCFTYLTLLSTEVLADAGWTGYGRLVELQPTTAERFLVKINVKSNRSDCKNKQWFYSGYNNTGSNYMFRALLEATSSKTNVRVYVTGACDLDGYSEISAVSIVP